MNVKNIFSLFLVFAILASAAAAIAQTNVGDTPVTSQNPQTSALEILKQKSETEIAQKLNKINEFLVRINLLKKISGAQKGAIQQELQSLAGTLDALRTKIIADTDLATLKKDALEIPKSSRIYLLIMPQAAIISFSDRALSIAEAMEKISEKLYTRINAITDDEIKSSAQENLTIFDTKISDAKTKAQSAVEIIIGLKPDGGNQTILKANNAALKSARAKIKEADADLRSARNAAGEILKALKARSEIKVQPQGNGQSTAPQN